MSSKDRLLLYVEDNLDHAELVLRTLGRHHPRDDIHHVEDGEAALQYLRSCETGSARRPALILLDLRLPKVDGLEVLRTVKSTPDLATIPVIVLSTSTSEADVSSAYEHHVNSYVVKPDTYPQLDHLMRHLEAYWMEWNQVSVGGA
jgi:CheY-like chemotaxis protein